MFVAFASMEVAGGTSTVGFKGHRQGAYVGVRELFDRVAAAAAVEGRVTGTGEAGGVGVPPEHPWRREGEGEERGESSESSSIGDGEESSLSLSSSTAGEEEEVESKLKTDALGSMDSLEDCLPTKRGLSSCFAGKSKSFASLSEAAALGSAGELAKPENTFNKRRRILMASKASWQRRASYAALATSTLRALQEDEDEDEEDDGEGSEGCGAADEAAASSPRPMERKKLVNRFRSPRSFSLCDLRQA